MWGNPRQSWSLGLWIPRRRFRIPGIGFPLSSASSAKASLCRRAAGTGKKEKESARGTMGTGKRHAPVFSLFPSSFPSFLFFDCCYFYWDIQREPVWRRELDSNLGVNQELLCQWTLVEWEFLYDAIQMWRTKWYIPTNFHPSTNNWAGHAKRSEERFTKIFRQSN